MTQPRNRSRSVRRVHKRMTAGKSTTHYEKREKGKRHSCALCQTELQGTNSLRSTAKTKKRPERKFGGHLCSKCSRQVISYAARIERGTLKPEEIGVRFKPYIEALVKGK